MIPHLRFYFHELVRAAAAEILPHLLQCVRSKGIIRIQRTRFFFPLFFFPVVTRTWLHLLLGMVVVRDMWALMADKLLEAIEMEPDAEIRTVMMDSLCKVLHTTSCLSPGEMWYNDTPIVWLCTLDYISRFCV